ncbi:hypothetical protein ES707_02060 [subsurface metagenome]|jgi:hypothetical protein
MFGPSHSAKLPRLAAIALLPLMLSACLSTGGEQSNPISFTDDRGYTDQPYPRNYKGEILAFMRTYLNNPAGVREAMMAEPVQRTVGGRLRYVSCLRYATRETDGRYREPRDRAVVYVDARLDRVMENPGDACSGATYAAFPELEKMSR